MCRALAFFYSFRRSSQVLKKIKNKKISPTNEDTVQCYRAMHWNALGVQRDAESSVKDAITLNFNDCLVTIGSQLQQKLGRMVE